MIQNKIICTVTMIKNVVAYTANMTKSDFVNLHLYFYKHDQVVQFLLLLSLTFFSLELTSSLYIKIKKQPAIARKGL